MELLIETNFKCKTKTEEIEMENQHLIDTLAGKESRIVSL